MATIRQPSFAGGVIAPQLWGRTDLPLHASSVRTLKNFFVSHHGALISRPGFVYVGLAKNGSAPALSFVGPPPSPPPAIRLVPFIYSDAQSYVLEFGDSYIRFWSYGERVESAPTIPLEVVTTYLEDELPYLKFAQSGDVLTICHPNHPPAELSRVSHTNWTLSDIDFDRPALDAGMPMVMQPIQPPDASHPARLWQYQVTQLTRDAKGFVTESAPWTVTQKAVRYYREWDTRITYAVGTRVTKAGTEYRSLLAGNLNNDPAALAPWWVVDASAHTSPAPCQIDPVDDTFAIYPDSIVNLEMDPILNGAGLSSTDPNNISYRIYRGRGGLFGWVGDTDTNTFADLGDEPDYTRQPPQGRNPFKVYDSTGALIRTENPAVVAFFEERRVFANTTERPAFIWLSATGDYANFDSHLLAVASDAAEYELACRKREEIRNLVSREKLFPLTNSSAWSFSGSDGRPVSPVETNPPDAKAHLDVGSSWLDGLVVGNAILMSRTKGVGVRDIVFDLNRNAYNGGDLSRHAQHLLQGYTLNGWAYAEDPWGVVWGIRSDGKLLSLTYDKDEGIAAWALHETPGDLGNDTVISICSVPEATEDAVYVAVRRRIGVTNQVRIERMASRILPLNGDGEADTAETIALDGCVTYRGAAATTISGLDSLDNCSVYALADGVVCGPYSVNASTHSIDISDAMPDGASVVHVGFRYDADVETLDIAQTQVATKEKNVKAVAFEVEASRGLYLGENFVDLVPWRQRSVADGYGPPSAATTMALVYIKSTWNRGGRAALRQQDPLFVSIYGLTREVEFGGT